jgi:hypothetical protein
VSEDIDGFNTYIKTHSGGVTRNISELLRIEFKKQDIYEQLVQMVGGSIKVDQQSIRSKSGGAVMSESRQLLSAGSMGTMGMHD